MTPPGLLSSLKEATADAPTVTYSVNSRGYTIDGKRYRRVTGLVGGGIPKPALLPWGIKSVAEYAYEHRDVWSQLPKTDAIKALKQAPYTIRDDAGDRGTAIHKTLEALLGNTPMPQDLNEDEQACADSALDFLAQRDSTHLATELTVFNDTVGYAGTLDLWEMDKDGVLWILDYKTSQSGVFPNMAIQQIAYQRAEFALVQAKPIPGQKASEAKVIPWGPQYAQRLGIVHILPTGATLYPIRDPEGLMPVLQSAILIKRWLDDTDTFRGKVPREHVYEDPITFKELADE